MKIPGKGEQQMSIVKVIEVIAQSDKGWQEAAQEAVREAGKTVRNIKSVYVQDMQGLVEGTEIVNYRVIAKVSFLVEPD
jgi:flavin-binding protein dodecin